MTKEEMLARLKSVRGTPWQRSSEQQRGFPGLRNNPIAFQQGAKVFPSLWYTMDGATKRWTGDTAECPEWTDERFVGF